MPSRRSFLATLGAAALGAAVQPSCASGAARTSRRLDRVGLQLYTVRSEMQRDVDATLAAVAAIGYTEVEFAGYFDRTPTEIRAMLRQHGLAAPSSHIPFERLNGDWQRVLDEAQAMGHAYVTIPWIAAAERRTIDDWKRVAALFNERAQQARTADLQFAYHNHAFEFEPSAGVLPYDVLLAETEPDLVSFELDVYWAARAGHDPIDVLGRHPGRFSMTHLKDSAGPPDHAMVDVGSGTLDFDRILAVARGAGVRHHFVEHDEPADPLRSIRASYAYLAGAGAD